MQDFDGAEKKLFAEQSRETKHLKLAHAWLDKCTKLVYCR